uniref:Uncharacterized protein n=1 Tax=Anguilla anguilla TaxID=7936 RepID=A0A0E9VRN9_ANGAN
MRPAISVESIGCRLLPHHRHHHHHHHHGLHQTEQRQQPCCLHCQ